MIVWLAPDNLTIGRCSRLWGIYYHGKFRDYGWDKKLPQKKLVREDVMRDEEESQESQGDESARAIAHQGFNKLRVSSQSEPSWLCGVFSL